jgi:coenzyme F420 hydrogenase subunit beta
MLDGKLHATISIFCAGTPSTEGTLELLRVLGVSKEQITELRYRGRGWPGMTGVATNDGDGRRVEMAYRKAWDEILTKHIPFRCKICPDGTGQFADIACGDPWYRPIEEGEKGSSLILARTERGREILHKAMETGYIVAEPRGADVLPRSQEGLLMRRRSLWPKVVWAGMCGWPLTRFRGMHLLRNWLALPLKKKWASFYRGGRYLLGLRRRGPQRPTAVAVAEAETIKAACMQGKAQGAAGASDPQGTPAEELQR